MVETRTNRLYIRGEKTAARNLERQLSLVPFGIESRVVNSSPMSTGASALLQHGCDLIKALR